MSLINPTLWILNPNHPDAPKSLRFFIESSIEGDMLERMSEEDAHSQQGQYEVASAALGVLDELPALAQGAVESLAHDANKTGIYRVGEHESIYEFLASFLNPDRARSLISDASFLMSQVVPFMEAKGLDPNQIIGKNNRLSSKFRAAIPLLRDALHEHKDPKTLSQTWEDILELAGDDVTSEDEIRARRENRGKKVPIIQAAEFIESGGESILVMRLSRKQRALFDNRMGGKVNYTKGYKWPKTARSVK